MFSKINFDTLLNDFKKSGELKRIIYEELSDTNIKMDESEVLEQFKEGFFSVKNSKDMSKVKFYRKMQQILNIERKVD